MHPSHQHQQLQPFGTVASTNSAHSSPLKRVPPPPVSPLASPMESRRLFVPPAPTQPSVSSSSADSAMLSAIQLGYTLAGPQPARLLVDPQTGQQYFVPANPQPMSYFAAPPPLFYPNQFYSTPAPTATAAQSHSGFMFTNQPPTTLWSPHPLGSASPPSHQRQRAQSPSSAQGPPCSTFGGGAGHHQTHNHQPFSSSDYHVEVPLSSVGSVCEDTEFDQYQQRQQEFFRRQHQIRLSTESRGSLRSSGGNNRPETYTTNPYHKEDPSGVDRLSPPPAGRTQPAPPRQLLQLQPDRNSTGGSSSESTSGFASGRDRLRTEDVSDGRSPPQSPLMRKERAYFPTTQNEYGNSHRSESPKSPSLPKPLPRRMKAIRMDIDLNRPVSPPEHEQVSVRVLRTVPSTAFTVSFNDPSPRAAEVLPPSDPSFQSVGGARELSLQEAARQAPTGRRLMATRRSVPPRPVPEKVERTGADSGSETGDPKRWLFRKMMIGRDQCTKDTEGGDGNGDASDDDADDDMVSETGTYVVESKQTSQVQARTDSAPFSCPRGDRSGSNSVPPSTCSPSSSNSSRTPSPSPKDNEVAASGARRSLMTDLRRLREQKKSAVPPPKSKAFLPRVPASQPIAASQTRPCRQPMPSTNATKRTDNTPFRPKTIVGSVASRCRSEPRSDGGRFSMRGTQPAVKGQPKANLAKDTAVQQQTPEMVAWLRRKEYDPRRAAATADQSQREAQQRQQQLKRLAPLALPEECLNESFIAARSFSTSANAKSPFARWRQSRKDQPEMTMGDQRANRSHDDLSRLGESMDEESIPGGAGHSCSNSLQRTVNELTQKCHKSIELLKLCNQSGLSSSVEQLLERVVGDESETDGRQIQSEGRANNENISDRLERLSSAFDAIQKYLEEQTSMNSSRASLAALAGGKGQRQELTENKCAKKQTQ